ncbi:MAG: Rieske 2Fe-2S domain-containing protein, partial [Hyphomicrobiaceae bacterium]
MNIAETTTTEEQLPRTLPSWTYCDQDFFEAEIKTIHKRAWQIVCHVSDIPNTGDYFTFQGLGERAFVIRGEDGIIRAFHNVCPHRAHAVVSGLNGNSA